MQIEHPFSSLDSHLPVELQAAVDTVVRMGPTIVQWRRERRERVAEMARTLEPLSAALRESMRGHVKFINPSKFGVHLVDSDHNF